MNVVDIHTTFQQLTKLDISDRTTHADADAAMSIVGDFDRCVVGVVYFAVATPWEYHPDADRCRISPSSGMRGVPDTSRRQNSRVNAPSRTDVYRSRTCLAQAMFDRWGENVIHYIPRRKSTFSR
jgi:hypothetical protein